MTAPMAVYAIHCIDKPLQHELRAAHADAHRRYVAALGARVVIAGRLLDDDGAPIGTMMAVQFADRRAAMEFAANDPLARAGLYASVAVTAWEQMLPE